MYPFLNVSITLVLFKLAYEFYIRQHLSMVYQKNLQNKIFCPVENKCIASNNPYYFLMVTHIISLICLSVTGERFVFACSDSTQHSLAGLREN